MQDIGAVEISKNTVNATTLKWHVQEEAKFLQIP